MPSDLNVITEHSSFKIFLTNLLRFTGIGTYTENGTVIKTKLKVKYFKKRRGYKWVAKEVLRSDVFKVVTNIQ